jgi:hypothetical protein
VVEFGNRLAERALVNDGLLVNQPGHEGGGTGLLEHPLCSLSECDVLYISATQTPAGFPAEGHEQRLWHQLGRRQPYPGSRITPSLSSKRPLFFSESIARLIAVRALAPTRLMPNKRAVAVTKSK